jgi:hypothetical protein
MDTSCEGEENKRQYCSGHPVIAAAACGEIGDRVLTTYYLVHYERLVYVQDVTIQYKFIANSQPTTRRKETPKRPQISLTRTT